jgi:hypothetical protein
MYSGQYAVEEAMQCHTCGAPCGAKDKYCRNCGRRLHCPADSGTLAAGTAPQVNVVRLRRVTAMLKASGVSVVLFSVALLVLAQAMPGLFRTGGFGAMDLGITWSDAQYASAMKKTGVTVDDPPQEEDRSKFQEVFTGSKNVDWSFSESEVTALLNGGEKAGYWPFGNTQVKICPDNVLEFSCVVNPVKLLTFPAVSRALPDEIKSYIDHIPLQLPVHARAKVLFTGPKQVDITIQSLNAAGMSFSAVAMGDQVKQILEGIANDMLAEAGPVRVENFTTIEGSMRLQGTWYEELKRIPAAD